MRTETKEYKIYKFEELSEKSKEKAIEYFYDINVDHDWWDAISEEIQEQGGRLKEFDTGRSCLIKIDITSPEIFAREIIKNHGENCETYLTAKEFLDEINDLYSIDTDDLTYEQEQQIEEFEQEFIKAISEDYLSMLRKEYEYLTSEEAIIETIEANDYEFLENGEYYI